MVQHTTCQVIDLQILRKMVSRKMGCEGVKSKTLVLFILCRTLVLYLRVYQGVIRALKELCDNKLIRYTLMCLLLLIMMAGRRRRRTLPRLDSRVGGTTSLRTLPKHQGVRQKQEVTCRLFVEAYLISIAEEFQVCLLLEATLVEQKFSLCLLTECERSKKETF